MSLAGLLTCFTLLSINHTSINTRNDTVLETLAALSGVIATIWITFGVYIAAKFYPNYNHANQFCSELGAAGSPTEKIIPLY